LEGTYNDHLVQLPDHFRAYRKFEQIMKGIVQMPLKWFVSSTSLLVACQLVQLLNFQSMTGDLQAMELYI